MKTENLEVPAIVIDMSQELNKITNGHKTYIETGLLNLFDFESTSDYTKTKHYPVSYLCDDNPKDKCETLLLISELCWKTLYNKLHEVVSFKANYNQGIPCREHGDSPTPKRHNKKMGKLWISPPNRFCCYNMPLEEPKIFAFGVSTNLGFQIDGEINFGIEIY